jgi:hypothetical protein
MNDFGTEMKEKLLQEALQKRISDLTRRTIREYHQIFSEEFERYKISQVPGFHPSIRHFNDAFLFLQFIEALTMGYKNSVYFSMHATAQVMSDPFEMMKLLSDPKFKHFVEEFKAKTNREIN